MKKTTKNRIIAYGIACALFMAVSIWHSITFNDSRIIKPVVISEYTFRIQDLPMMIAIILFIVYVLYLCCLFGKAVIAGRDREMQAQTVRRINPKLGFLGFLGLLGFMGFWSYSVDGTISPFVFFIFFGFFGFYYEGKLSGTLMDERFKENKLRAGRMADKISFTIIFIAILGIGQGKLMGNLEYTLIAFVIVTALAVALNIFLNGYLLYRYDHDEQIEESGE